MRFGSHIWEKNREYSVLKESPRMIEIQGRGDHAI